MEKEFFLNISWKSFLRFLVFGLLLIILYLIRDLILVLLVSITISLAITPFVDYLEKIKIPRILGTLILFLLILGILGVVFYFFIPIFIQEIEKFFEFLNNFSSRFFGWSEFLLDLIRGNFSKIISFLKESNFPFQIPDKISQILNSFVLTLAGILMIFYLTVEKNGVENFLRVILPDVYEKPFFEFFENFKNKLRKWAIAQLILSSLVGLIAGLGSLILGIDYPFMIGILAAIFEITPIIGPILVGIVMFLISVSESLILGLYALIFFFVLQQVESHILTPLIVGKTMKVHPLVVLISLIGGAKIAGFWGLVLAVPIAIFIHEIVNYLSLRKKMISRLEL